MFSKAPAEPLQGRRVSLRPVEADDYPLLLGWQNDPDIAQWMDYRDRFSLFDLQRDHERARSEGHQFIVELESRPIGKCGLSRIHNDDRVCGLYLYIGVKELWGLGLGRDVVMALCRTAFDDLDLDRVELTMLESNRRARRVYEGCGFVPLRWLHGRAYRDGAWQQTMLMALGREAFEDVRRSYGI